LKNRNRRFGLIFLLVVTLILTTACASGPKDLTAGKTPEKIVEESFDKLYQLESYNMDMLTKMKMALGQDTLDMSMSGKITAFQKPLKMKMVMETTVPGMTEKMQIDQYMVEQEQKVMLYQYINGKWQKLVIDDPATVEMISMDPRDNLKLFMDNLVKAEILGEEVVGEKNTVKINLVASSKIFDQLFEETAGNSLGIGDDFLNADILSKIGDMHYTIWVDKATLETVKGEMDLTDNMKNMGQALAEDPKTPAELKQVFQNMEMSMEYTVYNQNSAEDFTVPEEAKSAEEIPFGNV